MTEEAYKTLETQIIALWKKRGMVVERIEVKAQDDVNIQWTVTARRAGGDK